MKKKIYFAPETTVVEIALQRMIALSKIEETANGSDALSREDEFEDEDDYVKSRRSRNCWDDEEELDDRDDRW